MSYINLVPLTSENLFVCSIEDAKVKYDEIITPKYINVTSYKEALQLVSTCSFLNENLSILCLKLKIVGTDYENIYPLSLVAPYLVDMDTIISEYSIYPLISTIKNYNNTKLALNVIQYINAYDYKSLSDNAKKAFIQEKAIYTDVFILETFKVKDIEFVVDYITTISPSCIPKVKLQDTILAHPEKYYVNLMHKNSYGLLNGFPWGSACITGGFVEKILSETIEQCKYSDIDIWIIGKNYNERKQNLNIILTHIINIFGEARCYLINRRSVIDIYIEDIPRSIQIISNDMNTMFDIISTFDLSHCSHGYIDGTFYCTAEAIQSLMTRYTKGICISNTNPKRIIKAIMANYNISEEIYNLQEITNILTDEKQIKSMIYNIIAVWYPTSSIMDFETRRMYNSAMLVKDTNYEIIDVKTALSVAVIGGHFNNDYTICPFMNVHITPTLFKYNSYHKKILFEDNKQLIIQSDIMSVTSFKIDTYDASDFYVVLTVDPSPNFRKFLDVLKETYKTIWCKKTDLHMDNLSIKLNSKKISYLAKKNMSIVVSNTNEPLDYNILNTKVNIQITFNVTTFRNKDNFNDAFVFIINKIIVG